MGDPRTSPPVWPLNAKTKSGTLVELSEVSGLEYVSAVPNPIMVQSQPENPTARSANPTSQNRRRVHIVPSPEPHPVGSVKLRAQAQPSSTVSIDEVGCERHQDRQRRVQVIGSFA